MLHIEWPPPGAILNRHDGTPTPEGLRIVLRGTAPEDVQVALDGVPVRRHGDSFAAPVLLTAHANQVTVHGQRGEEGYTEKLPLWWDRHSLPRYRFSIDDNILFLRDLARGTASSLFEHPYLAFWQRMHREYGTKIHFNIYWECEGFTLTEMPDRFRGEWQENADWLRLTFHARADKPDMPYLGAPAAQVEADYLAVTEQIARFAGEELLSPITTIHWGEATREACRALRRQGVRGLVGVFLPDGISDITHWHARRAGDREGRSLPQPSRPQIGYYLDASLCAYLRGHEYWRDPEEDIIFLTHDAVINALGASDLIPFLDDVAADPHRGEVVELIVHEQYFRPELHYYQPDIAARCEAAIRWATERGLRPAHYDEGFLGSPERGTP